MRIVKTISLISKGKYAQTNHWKLTRHSIHRSILSMEWPEGSGKFIIRPEPGKKRGKGNGVRPIKDGLMRKLKKEGWALEVPMNIATVSRPGKLDAVYETKWGPVALEWETGNISSSHRALNKMTIGLLKKQLACGILVVPSRKMYKYLTDRIGNIDELDPYLELWRSVPVQTGILEIIVIEHDSEDSTAQRIPKGTDGRALG